MSVATYTRLKMSPKSHLNSTFVLAGESGVFVDLRSCNKMSSTGGCHQTVHYDSYTDHRGVEPVRQRKSELTAVERWEVARMNPP